MTTTEEFRYLVFLQGVGKHPVSLAKHMAQPCILEAHCGSCPGRETLDQIWVVRQLIERLLNIIPTYIFAC